MPPRAIYQQNKKHYNQYQKNWRQINLATEKARINRVARSDRAKLIAKYGGKCACCGERTFEFLALDHVKGGGTKERKRFKNPKLFYRTLLLRPVSKKYRVLCHNCNSSFGYYGYCPHNLEKS